MVWCHQATEHPWSSASQDLQRPCGSTRRRWVDLPNKVSSLEYMNVLSQDCVGYCPRGHQSLILRWMWVFSEIKPASPLAGHKGQVMPKFYVSYTISGWTKSPLVGYLAGHDTCGKYSRNLVARLILLLTTQNWWGAVTTGTSTDQFTRHVTWSHHQCINITTTGSGWQSAASFWECFTSGPTTFWQMIICSVTGYRSAAICNFVRITDTRYCIIIIFFRFVFVQDIWHMSFLFSWRLQAIGSDGISTSVVRHTANVIWRYALMR